MKKYILISLLLFVHIGLFAKESPKELFDQGNQQYKDGQFEQAIDTYSSIVKEGFQSSELFFNLGNSYYKHGEMGCSILFYEKALLLSPFDEDIKYNLSIAKQSIVDKIEEPPTPFYTVWYEKFVSAFSADTWGKINLVLFALFCILLLIFLIKREPITKKISFFLALFVLILVAFTFSFASTQEGKIVDNKYAVIMDPSVTVKGAPSEASTQLFIVHEGLKVKITDTISDWTEIELTDRSKGWVPNKTFSKI